MEGQLGLNLGGAALQLLGSGAVYWPEFSTLFAADLHLGKAETLQQAGMPVPTGHSLADLDKLSRIAQQVNAKTIYILGDLVHARAGLTEQHVNSVADWFKQSAVPVYLILGNHDYYAGVPATWDVQTLAEGVDLNGLILNHHTSSGSAPRLCGHLHPVVRLTSKLDTVRLRCFVLENNQLTLPAFGTVTGGTVVNPEVNKHIYAAVGDTVVEITKSTVI